MSEANIWGRFEHDPRFEAHSGLRASDRDRDVVNDVLGSAYAEGRLTADEFDERSTSVARTRTLGELPPLVSDLVAPGGSVGVSGRFHAEAERKHREHTRNALWSFLTPTVICWIIWIAVLLGGGGTWFPWPAFVTIGTGAPWLRLATSKADSIASIERDLEKREVRRLSRQQRRQLPPGASGPQ